MGLPDFVRHQLILPRPLSSRVELDGTGLFIRYIPTTKGPLPDSNRAARAIGRGRIVAFGDGVVRQLARGRPMLLSDAER
jgi:hypothetical protein